MFMLNIKLFDKSDREIDPETFLRSDASLEISHITATYSPAVQYAADSLIVPSTRGYHSANIVNLNLAGDPTPHPCLLVYGGLHRRGPTTKLEAYDLVTQRWHRGKVAIDALISSVRGSPKFFMIKTDFPLQSQHKAKNQHLDLVTL